MDSHAASANRRCLAEGPLHSFYSMNVRRSAAPHERVSTFACRLRVLLRMVRGTRFLVRNFRIKECKGLLPDIAELA